MVVDQTTIDMLRDRPVTLADLSPGDACPVTTKSSTPSADLGPMLGDGPARPVIGPTALIGIAPPENFGSEVWGGNKLLWALSESSGVALLRGRQLDGSVEARFGEGATPAAEKILDPTGRTPLNGGWFDFPGSVRLRQPGCYGFQIDVASGSSVVVISAT